MYHNAGGLTIIGPSLFKKFRAQRTTFVSFPRTCKTFGAFKIVPTNRYCKHMPSFAFQFRIRYPPDGRNVSIANKSAGRVADNFFRNYIFFRRRRVYLCPAAAPHHSPSSYAKRSAGNNKTSPTVRVYHRDGHKSYCFLPAVPPYTGTISGPVKYYAAVSTPKIWIFF